jgi:excisionase family DNA binding protein
MHRRLIPPQTFVRVPDLANLLGVCRGTVYNWLRRGELPRPVGGPGRSLRWPLDAIRAWADQRNVPLNLEGVDDPST